MLLRVRLRAQVRFAHYKKNSPAGLYLPAASGIIWSEKEETPGGPRNVKVIQELARHFYDRGQLTDDQIKYLHEKGYIVDLPIGYQQHRYEECCKEYKKIKIRGLRNRQGSPRFPNRKLSPGYYAGKNYKLRAVRAARRFSQIAIQEQLYLERTA